MSGSVDIRVTSTGRIILRNLKILIPVFVTFCRRFHESLCCCSRSGKSRRKAERRKWSLKEGSRNEDLALIEALHQAAGQAEERKSKL